jgi:acyl carrier protein
MDVPGINAALGDIIRDVLDDPDFEVTPQTSANDHVDWDSFNHVSIIVAVEMRFGIKFRTAEIESACTVGEFADLIARKCEAA